jgi:GT2 family glycosyltransferase
MPDKILSMIIPVRNQARALSGLLAALARLTRPPGWELEVIGVDNASSDNTLQVFRDNGVRLTTCAEIGVSAARNAGAKMAHGELLCFIDADACPVGDDFLVRMVKAAGRLGDFGILGGAIELPAEQARDPVAVADHWVCWFNWHAKRPAGKTTLFQPGVCLIMLRAVFDALNGFDTSLKILEDFEFQHRLQVQGYSIYYEPSLAVTHEARDSLRRSWQHSWSWGGPFRSTYLTRAQGRSYWFPVGHPCFCLNIPAIFLRRLRLVLRVAPPTSRWFAWCCLPLVAAGILVWTLGVVWGPDQPSDSKATPV